MYMYNIYTYIYIYIYIYTHTHVYNVISWASRDGWEISSPPLRTKFG